MKKLTGKAYMILVGMDCGEFGFPVKNMAEANYTDFQKDVRKLNMDNYS